MSDKPLNLHNHPIEGPVIIVHALHADLPIGPDNPAHAFGPFFSEADAERFDDGKGDDHCYRVLMELVVPPFEALGAPESGPRHPHWSPN